MNRSPVLLAAGAALGIAMAASSLLGDGGGRGRDLGASTAAIVNGVAIPRQDVESIAGTQQADPERRRLILERLVEEELLVQRGIELGLASRDPRVRSDLVAAVTAMVIAEFVGANPDDEDLGAFYQSNRDFFSTAQRMKIRRLFFRAGSGRDRQAEARAQLAASRLRSGQPFEEVEAELADRPVVALPWAWLPAYKLQDYLGPTATRTALGLEPGQVSEPLRSSAGFEVLVLVARRGGGDAAFEELRPQVLSEYRRRAGERALRDYIEELKGRAELVRTDQP
ncbi:MAG: peptidylprolyl isomerase [Deltaproteobacteria bacterium]